MTRRTDPAGAWDSLRYDRDGLVRSWTNRRGQTVTHEYDAAHRPTSKSGDSTATESWSYSADGRVVTATSPYATETTYLSAVGRLDSARTVMAGQTYWRRYLYTTAGLLDSAWTMGTGGIVFAGRRYVYNSTGALTDIRLGGVASYIEVNPDQLPSQVTLPSNRVVTRGYNGLHAVSALSATPGSPAGFFNAVFNGAAYDSLGRIVREVRNVEGTGMGVDYAGTGYTYDRLGRLRAESTIVNYSPPASCESGMIVDEYGNSCVNGSGWVATAGTTFSYDAVGNRTDRGGDYTTGNRIEAFDGCTYTTSPDGNVTGRSGACLDALFAWTAEGRLARVTAGGHAYTFHYNTAGRLVRRDVDGAVDRHFLWDGDNLLAELDAAGTGKLAEYSYWGMDRLHAVIVASTAYYGHPDVRGNTLALTADSVPHRRYWYDAWGTLTSGGDTPPFNGADRARWKGALSMGPELDLYYMRNRWYEPRTGRFLSEDPAGPAGGRNLYAFAHDDPINSSDPFGLAECPDGMYALAVVDNPMVEGVELPGRYVICVGSGGAETLIPVGRYTGELPGAQTGLGFGNRAGFLKGFGTGWGGETRRELEAFDVFRTPVWRGCPNPITHNSRDYRLVLGYWQVTAPGPIRHYIPMPGGGRAYVPGGYRVYAGTFTPEDLEYEARATAFVFCGIGLGTFIANDVSNNPRP